ncbi:hypothetical protein GCM10023320_78000 [Pseudonocardia adelaidensis]|uniref:Uncharacterized protein n=1 Tax=Pseudonocardia adelaidensis TaxID=648754 RepID=A0ABP9P8S2_9PSEU
MRVVHDALDEHTATVTADQLAEVEELTTEQDYAAALDDEQLWDLEPDGTLTEADEDERSPRAWRGDRQRW